MCHLQVGGVNDKGGGTCTICGAKHFRALSWHTVCDAVVNDEGRPLVLREVPNDVLHLQKDLRAGLKVVPILEGGVWVV